MFLITFGDDWTLGTGAWYKPAMPRIVYDNTEINYDDSWRIIVRDYFGCQNRSINFAAPNSSNQKQFALAKSYFNSKRFATQLSINSHSHGDTIVLWGLTTLRRDYKWCSDSKSYEDITLTEEYDDQRNKDRIGYGLNKWCYNNIIATRELEAEIIHWNMFFKALGIKNYWFDSYNSRNYTIAPSNFFDLRLGNRDLLSRLCIHHATNNRDSDGRWVQDPIRYALDNKLINPYTFLPKKEGHRLIAKYFIEKLS